MPIAAKSRFTENPTTEAERQQDRAAAVRFSGECRRTRISLGI